MEIGRAENSAEPIHAYLANRYDDNMTSAFVVAASDGLWDITTTSICSKTLCRQLLPAFKDSS